MTTNKTRALEYATDFGTYYATKQRNGYFLYLENKFEGEVFTEFVADFRDGEDFWYEVDKHREEVAYITRDALKEMN